MSKESGNKSDNKSEYTRMPETLTFDGKEIKVSDIGGIEKVMEFVRGQEKGKLYGQMNIMTETIEKLKDSVGDKSGKKDTDDRLTNLADGFTAQAGLLTTLTETVNKLVTVNSDDDDDKDKTVVGISQDVLTAQLSKVTDGFNEAVKTAVDTTKAESVENTKKLETQVQTLTDDLTKQKLDAHRDKVLAEAGDTVIPELVVGNTIEEIDESLEKSKGIKESVTSSVRKEHGIETPQPPAVSQKTTELITKLDVNNMDNEDFGKSRKEILIGFGVQPSNM